MNTPTATGARRWTRSLIAAVTVAAALPAAAEAGTAEVRDGELLYTARNAEVNNVNLRLGPTGKLVISDTAAKVAGAGCLLNGSGDLECDAASVTSIDVSLADRNDVMRYRAPHPGVVRAGLGSDTFFGGLRATPSGAVSYRGDEGLGDALRYTEADRGVTVTLASGANDGRLGDLENAGADIEILEGSRFGDTLTGSADDIGELFLGGNGNDTINGGDGPDRIDEGNARNGADTIDGGPGRDMIDYSRRNTGTGVTLNDIAEDGERTNIVEGPAKRQVERRGRDHRPRGATSSTATGRATTSALALGSTSSPARCSTSGRSSSAATRSTPAAGPTPSSPASSAT